MTNSQKREYGVLVLLLYMSLVFIGWGLSLDEVPPKTKLVDIVSKLGYAVLVAATVRFVSLWMSAEREQNSERYLEFERCGFVRVRPTLSSEDVKRQLENAERIWVRKTWFPENRTLEDGLIEGCVRGARIDLVLAHPSSEILRVRSLGAHCDPTHGGRTIRNALIRICSEVLAAGARGRDELRVRFYEGWPGVPIIRCDKLMLVGFYPLGKSSPDWPWFEVGYGSKLWNTLDRHHDEPDCTIGSPADAATAGAFVELRGAAVILEWLQELPPM